jgi:hypothetical protein
MWLYIVVPDKDGERGGGNGAQECHPAYLEELVLGDDHAH